MRTLQENQSLNAEYEKNQKIRILEERLQEYQEYIDINHKEIERLNNIINELESFINMALEIYNNVDLPTLRIVKDKIKELKGVDKE